MVLAAILWVCALPQTDDLGKFSAALKANGERQTLSVTPFDSTSRDSIVRAASPSAPEPKVTSEAEPAVLRSSAEPVQPVRATAGRPGESPRQRKTWYGLMAAAHAAAGFDAWTTRRAISSGYGREANPFLKPFASSNAIYAAIQVSPSFMDFLSKRVFAGGQAQPGRCALEELEADTLKSSLEGPKIPQPPTKGVPAHPPAGTLCFLARRRDLGRRRSCIF